MKRCSHCQRVIVRAGNGVVYDRRIECLLSGAEECQDVAYHYHRGMVDAASMAVSGLASLGRAFIGAERSSKP